MGPRGRRAGFTVIELVIAIVITGVLVAIAIPFEHRAIDEAKGAVMQYHLRNALFAEISHYLDYGAFTSDRSRLLAIDPSLPLSDEGQPGSIYIAISAAPTAPAICLFAEAGEDWYTLYYSTATGETSRLVSPKDCTRRMLEEQLDAGAGTPGTRSLLGH